MSENPQDWNDPSNVAEWKHQDIAIPISESNILSIPTITKREEILQAALQCVMKDRQATHGKPENSFADIAHLWSWFTGHTFTPYEVAVMMSLMKMARIKGNPDHEDSKTDLAGYIAIAAELKSTDSSLTKF